MQKNLKVLSDVCDLRNGFAFKSSLYKSEGIPLLRISNFDNGNVFLNENQIYVDKNFIETKKDFIVEKGDVLIALSGATTGKYGIYNFDFPSLLNQRIGLIKSGESKELNSMYFYYYLNILKVDILRNAGGAAQPNISTTKIADFKIPLPPLETQKRIAAILDDAAALRDKTQQLLTEYDQLAQSIFLEMFGDPVLNPKEWELKKLNDLCGIGSSRRVFVDELVESGIPFYRGKEIGAMSTGESINADLFITQDHYNNLADATGVPKIGDLLMPSICPDGRILRVSDNEPFYFKDGRVLWIKVNQSKVNSYYLIFFLRELFRTSYHNIASGTTFAELKIVALKKIKTLIPPIELQNQFANKIDLIEQQKELAKKELKESEDLFNCLLQKAFKGELV